MSFLNDLHSYLDDLGCSPGKFPGFQRNPGPPLWQDLDEYLPAYALEIRAVSPQVADRGSPGELTSLGRVFLDLRGRDAVRWLLLAELAQTSGRSDPFRLSSETLMTLLAAPERTALDDGWRDAEDLFRLHFDLHSVATLRRLAALDILELIDDRVPESFHDKPLGYRVLPSGRTLLQEVSGEKATPMGLLMQALLEESTGAALAPYHPSLQRAIQDSSMQAITRQARLVAHELRNALLPVQSTIEVLIVATSGRGLTPAEADQQRTGLERSLNRIDRFVHELLDPPASLPSPELVEASDGVPSNH